MQITNSKRGPNLGIVKPVYDALGGHSPRQEIISSAALSIFTFFYFFTIGSFFNVTVYLLEARITYGFTFKSFIFGEQSDHVIVIATTLVWFAFSLKTTKLKVAICVSFIVILLIFTYVISSISFLSLICGFLIAGTLTFNAFLPMRTGKRCYFKFVSFNKSLYLAYLSIIGIYIGVTSLLLTLSVFLPVDVLNLYLRDYVYQIYLLLASLSPVLLTLLVFSLPVKLFINKVDQGFANWKERRKNSIHHVAPLRTQHNTRAEQSAYGSSTSSEVQISTKERARTRLILFTIMAGSSIMTLIPWYSSTLPEDREGLIGVDTRFYVDWAKGLILISENFGIHELLNQVFVVASQGDRPISLLFIFLLAEITQSFGEISTLMITVPMILAPLLVLAIFFMTREMTLSVKTSLFASFLTIFSFQISVGIYGGLYANWLALIVGYACFGILFSYLRGRSIVALSLFSMLLVILLFTHTYTWVMFAVVIGIFLVIQILRPTPYARTNLWVLLLVLASVVVINVLKSGLLGTSSGIDAEVEITDLRLDFGVLIERWETIVNTTQQFFGGLLGNSIIYLLGVYWLVRCKIAMPSNLVIFVFLSIGIAPLLIGDWVVQSRVLYNIPFQVPAGIAIVYLLQRHDKKTKENVKSVKADRILLVTAVFIWSLAVSARLLFNFYAT